MSHYTPMHARDGQRRDAWRAAARDTWTRLRSPLADALRWCQLTAAIRKLRAQAAALPPDTPGAVSADDGTGASAGEPRAPAAAALPPAPEDAAAPLPRPGPSQPPGPGQPQRPAWVTCPGEHPMPSYKGDYARTQPFRAIGAVPVSVVRPYYPAVEARRDSVARWGA